MMNLENIKKNGIKINSSVKLFINLCGLIADAPSLAKSLNFNQFNGKYGCIKCLNPGDYAYGKMIFEYSKNMIVRTNEIYKKQVSRAIETKNTFVGVKGQAYLSNLIIIPENVIIDYMHTSCIGTIEQLLNLWMHTKTNSHNEMNCWYLGKYT